MQKPDQSSLNTILEDCRQCGTCCKKYRKVLLQADEIDFIKKMGGHVGIDLQLSDLRDRSIEDAAAEARKKGKVYMIHPDSKGCIFLEKRNNQKYHCRIYHLRPKVCRSFRCNFADNTFQSLFGEDAICLLGQDRFGLPIKD